MRHINYAVDVMGIEGVGIEYALQFGQSTVAD